MSTFAQIALQQSPPAQPTFDYVIYGLRLRTQTKLTLQEAAAKGTADIELTPGTHDSFDQAITQITQDCSNWINIHELPDHWSYVRYDRMFEFLISPSGDRVLYRLLADVSLESFQTYALGRIFSFALVKKGYEPLHAATIVIKGHAVAFMGASAFGKSSLAACFVAAGYPLLTDDVLLLKEEDGGYLAFPGPPRLKLLPRVARMYLGDVSAGVPINNRSLNAPKRVFSLPDRQYCASPMPLRAIYMVTEPRKVFRRQRIALGSLPAVEALVKVLTFTHNRELTSPDRLARQFDAARRLIEKVPVRSLSYPRVLASLSNVKTAIITDLINYVDPI